MCKTRKNSMAVGIWPRTPFYKFSFSFSKNITSLSQLPNSQFSSNTSNPQSFNPTNSPQESQCGKHVSLANLFQRYCFPPSELHGFIAKNNFLLNSNVSDLEQSLKILSSFKLHRDVIVSMVFGCPAILELGFLKKWEVGICSLGSLANSSKLGLSVLELSRRFQIDPDEFSGRIKVLRGLGFSESTIGKILENFPGVVLISEQELQKRVDFWTVVGLERKSIDKIYSSFPAVLSFPIEDRLKPLFDEFLDMGFGFNLVKQEIVKNPRILGLELGEVFCCLELLKRVRCRISIKEKIFSEGEFKPVLAVKLRVDYLHKCGLARRDALNILKREPRSIIYSMEDIVQKVEFLLQRMKLDIDSLIDVPEYLGVHFDKQIVPRHNVIEYLRSIGGLGSEVGLRDIIKPSRIKFYNFYVKPYPECEKMYRQFSDNVETKSRHPAGLWKLFKTPKYLESKEDVRNMKSSVESLVC